MAQRKFGTRRRAMLSFERQPFPAPCHVDQDVAHSRAWCALGHLTTFDRVLSALYRRNHLPTPPCTRPMLPRTSLCGQRRFTPGVHFGGNSDLCATSSCARFGSALYGGLGSHHPFGSSPLAPPASRPACRVEGFQNLHQHLRRGDRAERARNHSGLAQLFGRCRRGGGNFCRALLSTPRLLSQRSLCLRC